MQRASITGTTTRRTIGKYYRALLSQMRGHPELNGPKTPPRSLAESLLPYAAKATGV